MTSLNSSLMSSLWASKRRRIRSERSANHLTTVAKSYERAIRCFSPLRTPGESMIVTLSRSSEGHTEAWAMRSDATSGEGNTLVLGSYQSFALPPRPPRTPLTSNLFRKAAPKLERPPKGSSGTTVREFPLITFFSLPCTTAINLSVVGSGPICAFG